MRLFVPLLVFVFIFQGCSYLDAVKRSKTNEKAKGTAQKGIYLKTLSAIPIIVAPLEEQKRIADKLDSLLAKVEACKARLDKVPEQIKRFRQSVLIDAVTGELTEEWREEHPKVKNAEVLLERIREEREK